jgi:hypothetical protein
MMKRFLSLGVIGLTLAASSAQADIVDFGGYLNKFKGGGDKIPPQCQVDFRTASVEPFSILWVCNDDNAPTNDIRTEFWLFKKGAEAPVLADSFLGFPAGVQVNPQFLGVQNFQDGLPFQFRVLAYDKAGNIASTDILTVNAQDNTLETCTLNIASEGTESSGDTTGQPAGNVTLTEAAVTVTQTSETQIQVRTKEPVEAAPCEIAALCEDSDISFTSNITIGHTAAFLRCALGKPDRHSCREWSDPERCQPYRRDYNRRSSGYRHSYLQ